MSSAFHRVVFPIRTIGLTFGRRNTKAVGRTKVFGRKTLVGGRSIPSAQVFSESVADIVSCFPPKDDSLGL